MSTPSGVGVSDIAALPDPRNSDALSDFRAKWPKRRNSECCLASSGLGTRSSQSIFGPHRWQRLTTHTGDMWPILRVV